MTHNKKKFRAKTKKEDIAASASSVSIAVFLSRILGLVREQVLAGLFGASTAMDAFVVAFRIPNLLRDLFAEGALSSAFVTVFTSYDQKKSEKETWFLVNNVLTVTTIIISIIILLGITFSWELVNILAPDFSKIPGKVELTQKLTIIMFPFLLFISQAALLMGILNTRGFFFIPSFASACFNLASIIIGGGLALALPNFGKPAIIGMAVGTLVGGIAQLAIQAPLLLRQGFRLRPVIRLKDPGLRKIGRLTVPAIIGLSATQINIFINTNFAARCAEGSVAWLNYAFRLMQFPIGLFGVAISLATLPVVARQAAERKTEILGKTFVSSLNLAFALTIPASVGLWVLADPIIRLIFEHGEFSSFDTVMTAQALRLYTIGLFAYSAVKIIVPIFYALNDTRWPVIGSFLAVGSNLFIILITLERLQHKAIALSTSLTMILNFLLLAIVLFKKIKGYPIKEIVLSLTKIAAATTFMGFAVKLLNAWMGYSHSFSMLLVKVVFLVATGGLTYVATALLLNIHEIKNLIIGVKKKFF